MLNGINGEKSVDDLQKPGNGSAMKGLMSQRTTLEATDKVWIGTLMP